MAEDKQDINETPEGNGIAFPKEEELIDCQIKALVYPTRRDPTVYLVGKHKDGKPFVGQLTCCGVDRVPVTKDLKKLLGIVK